MVENKIHSVPMGLIRFWMEEAREELGLDEAKGWAIHKWNERRMNRNFLPHLPTSRHKKHKGILVSTFDSLTDRLCLDKCKMCLRWIEKVLHRQSGWHTYEDKMYILSFHPDRVRIYNSSDNMSQYYKYPHTWSYWDSAQEKDIVYTHTSPWDYDYDDIDVHPEIHSAEARSKHLHNKFLHITKDAVMVSI